VKASRLGQITELIYSRVTLAPALPEDGWEQLRAGRVARYIIDEAARSAPFRTTLDAQSWAQFNLTTRDRTSTALDVQICIVNTAASAEKRVNNGAPAEAVKRELGSGGPSPLTVPRMMALVDPGPCAGVCSMYQCPQR
jgi:hypothetical protein